MADHEHATIKHSDQLLLDQFLLRLPNELLRKNFRSAHFNIEKDTHVLKAHLKDAGSAAASGKAQPADVLRSLDTMLARTRGMKRKLEAYAAEERTLHEHAASRIRHLDELYGIRTVDDVQYDAWSRKRLDRLVGDYLLRNGYGDTANVLAGKDGMEPLMDVSTFTTMSRVARSILDGSVTEALAWCAENKKELRKNESPLEFKLRLQQYIELLRSNTPAKTEEAIVYAKKHIVPYRSQYPREVQQACGLLAIPPSLAGSGGCAYGSVYEPRWAELATLFTETHNKLLSLPSVPLLHVALSSGLSALKTPACHAHDAAAGTQPAAQAKGVCPICSTELNDLAKAVPYAHHTKSYVEHDLVLLPSGRAVGRQRLLDEAAKAGLDEGFVKDQANGAVVPVGDCRRVYIT